MLLYILVLILLICMLINSFIAWKTISKLSWAHKELMKKIQRETSITDIVIDTKISDKDKIELICTILSHV